MIMKKIFKNAIFSISTILLSASVYCTAANTESDDFIIALDPGHGGKSTGCVYTYDGKEVLEKDLNLKIAKYLKEKLEKNYKTKDGEKVVVYLTRENDEDCPDLEDRVKIPKGKGAKALISLHNNAHADTSDKRRGCMVLVTNSKYNNLYDQEEALAKSIINQLTKLKISVPSDAVSESVSLKGGLLRRLSDDGSKYENGDTTDWYGIIRHGINYKLPSILVEHAYLSVEEDYRDFLSSDEKLEKLASADAKGIAKHFNLVKNKPKKDKSKKDKSKEDKPKKDKSKKNKSEKD